VAIVGEGILGKAIWQEQVKGSSREVLIKSHKGLNKGHANEVEQIGL